MFTLGQNFGLNGSVTHLVQNNILQYKIIEFFYNSLFPAKSWQDPASIIYSIFLTEFISIWFNSINKKLLLLFIWFWKIKIICIYPYHIQIHLVSGNYYFTMVISFKGNLKIKKNSHEMINIFRSRK